MTSDWEKAWIAYLEPKSVVEEPGLTTTYTDDSLFPKYKQYLETPLRQVPAAVLLNEAAKGGLPNELKKYIYLNFSKLLEREAIEHETVQPDLVPVRPVQKPAKLRVDFICQKITYATEAIAKGELREIKKKDQKHKKPQRAYECPICSGWHLSSKDFIPRYKNKKN